MTLSRVPLEFDSADSGCLSCQIIWDWGPLFQTLTECGTRSFKKWIVARNRDGLQIQMILFRFAYNNFYEQEQRPSRERGRISVAEKMNVLREQKLKRLSKK